MLPWLASRLVLAALLLACGAMVRRWERSEGAWERRSARRTWCWAAPGAAARQPTAAASRPPVPGRQPL